MHFSTHVKTYDIPRSWIDRKTGWYMAFPSPLWTAMAALVGQGPDIGIITVISGSKTEKLIGEEITKWNNRKKSVDPADKS